MTTSHQFRFVGVSFRSDGSGKLYSYKVPLDWPVAIGRKLKIDARDGGWQTVIIKELDPKPVFGVDYKWAKELWADEPKDDAPDTVSEPTPETPTGGGLIGHALAVDMLSPDSQTCREIMERDKDTRDGDDIMAERFKPISDPWDGEAI